MWPEPWSLSLVMPVSALDARTGRLVWLLLQLLVLLLALELCWRVYGGDPEQRWVAWLVAFTSLPIYLVLVTWQMGTLMLLGLVGFLLALQRGWPFLAGACL